MVTLAIRELRAEPLREDWEVLIADRKNRLQRVGFEVLWRQRERQSPVAFKGVPNVQQRQPDDCAVLVVVDRVPIRSLKTRVPPAGARRR
jgi:hypothetical protein